MRPALALLVVGCASAPIGPELLRFEATPEHLMWYMQAASCAGRSADLTAVEWYIRPGGGWGDGPEYREGEWRPPHQLIFAQTHVYDAWLVRHEALHDLHQTGQHPSPPFGVCEMAASVVGKP